MDSHVSEGTSNADDDFTAREEFLGKNRSLRPSDRNEVDSEVDSAFVDEAEAEVYLDHVVWSKLPEELLIHIFARLPVKNILQIRSLSKCWRSTISSPQFQQVFSEASLVTISLLHEINNCDTIFFSQANREGTCRPSYNQRFAETVFRVPYDIAGTASGLICVNKYKEHELNVSNFRVFVMNVVTGIYRELPSPRITTERPTLVQMKANVNGSYTITFIYTKDREELQVTSWQVYDSVTNVWSKDEGRALAGFKDVEVFNMCFSLGFSEHYEVPATFHKDTKAINVFNLYEGDRRYDPWVYPSNPNGHVHNVSGELYKLCTQEGRHGVWRLLSSSKWEMVYECPNLEGVWTWLRVVNDLVVLIIELPVPYRIEGRKYCAHGGTDKIKGRKYCAHGGIVKVFHMPTKVWHSFPEDEYFTTNFRFNNKHSELHECPILVEVRFDSVP